MPLDAMQDPKQYITKEQALAAIEKTTNRRDEILVSLLWYTGARVSELLQLPLSRIDFEQSCVTIKSLKQRSHSKEGTPIPDHYRSVPVPDHIMKKIFSFIQDGGTRESEYLFTYDGKQPLSRQAAWTIVRDACIAAGVTRFGDKKISKRGFGPHPHVFRHGFAMNWLKKGGRPEQLQTILGHRDYDTTRSYQRFTPKDLRDEYSKVFGEKKD